MREIFVLSTKGIDSLQLDQSLKYHPLLYNKQYMTRMLTNGWELAGTEEENQKARAALGMSG